MSHVRRSLHLRGHPHAARQAAQRLAERSQAGEPGRRSGRRTAQAQPRPRREPDQRPDPRRGVAGRRPGRRHRPDRGIGRRAARDHRWRPAQPVLRLGPGGRQHRRAEGALRLGRPGAGRRRRVDEPRPDGLRRRRLGDRPGDQLPTRLRAAGHRRRPDRHHRGLLPRGRRRLRAAQPAEGRRSVVGRLLREIGRAGSRPERSAHPRPRRAHAARHPRSKAWAS